MYLVFAVVLLSIWIGLTLMTQLRQRWARLTYTAFFLVSLPFQIYGLYVVWHRLNWTLSSLQIVQSVLSAIAIFLLFLPVTNAWFRK